MEPTFQTEQFKSKVCTLILFSRLISKLRIIKRSLSVWEWGFQETKRNNLETTLVWLCWDNKPQISGSPQKFIFPSHYTLIMSCLGINFQWMGSWIHQTLEYFSLMLQRKHFWINLYLQWIAFPWEVTHAPSPYISLVINSHRTNNSLRK